MFIILDKNMKKILIAFLLVTAAFSINIYLSGCEPHLKPAIGKEDEIFVLADSTQWEHYYEILSPIFEKEIITPQPEMMFNLKRIDFSELNKFKNRKNLLIVATLSNGDKVSEYVKSILDSASYQLVISGNEFAVKKKDVWSKDQVLVIMASNTIEELRIRAFKNSDNLLYYFQKASDDRVMNNLYNPKYERKELEAKYLNDYGWMLYIQADFVEAINNPKEKFVWLRRSPDTDMERWMFVHWIDSVNADLLNNEFIVQTRNSVTQKFYKTMDDKAFVEIAQENISHSEFNLNGKYAIFSQGLWRMNDFSMGGPFVNYTFYDEANKRIYMLDGSVFSPRYEKKSLIQQVDVNLRTFRTKAELPKEKKNELFELLEK
ncbi:MAG: DUF4837 family protein [Ignavibacteria bacterium]|nr:DUF4837 family protein [Ignavibacteria bacterium]